MWQQFDNGATIGGTGCEGGLTVRDEEHAAGARATLERECGTAPWIVTCGIYGWFFHTRYLGSEAEAEFPAMLDGLTAIIDIIPLKADPDVDSKISAVCDAIQQFVDRFP